MSNANNWQGLRDVTEGEDVKRFLDRHEEEINNNPREDVTDTASRGVAFIRSVPGPLMIVLILVAVIFLVMGIPTAGLAMWHIMNDSLLRDRFWHLLIVGVIAWGAIFMFFIFLLVVS